MQSLRFLFLVLPLVLSACVFDDDTAFIPGTQAVYLLTGSAQGQDRQLWKGEAGTFVPDYEGPLGIGTVGEMWGTGRSLWVSDLQAQELVCFALPAETRNEQIQTGSLVPHHFAIGEEYCWVSDTVQSLNGWINRKTGTIDTFSMDGTVSHVIYREPFFSVVVDSLQWWVYFEGTKGALFETSLATPVEQLYFNPLESVFRVLGESSNGYVYQSWSLQARDLVRPGQVPYRLIRYSPLQRQETGQEWLSPISLRGALLHPQLVPGVSSISVDFYQSQLYYQSGDSLYFYDMRVDTTKALSALPEPILGDFVYWDFPGQ